MGNNKKMSTNNVKDTIFEKAVNPPPPEGTIRPTPPPRIVVVDGVVRIRKAA
jgi:hypothetical protein